MTSPAPISHVATNNRILDLAAPLLKPGSRVVDVGAGEGYFSQLLAERVRSSLQTDPADVVRACDLYPEFFRYPDVPCDPIDAAGTFPYADGSFDVAVSVEVVEHLQDQFHFLREIFRVVRPGGRAFVSTPNLLNINSRLRYMHSGFWLLFDPLPLTSHDPRHTSGHIHPVTAYYLAYLFARAGFIDIRIHFDRHKRSAAALAALTWPLRALPNALFERRLRRKQPATAAENGELVRSLNGWGMLTSRSIIVEGRRPGSSDGADTSR